MSQTKHMKSARSGFTLVELMIVITVIAILSTMALFGLTGAQKSARDTQRMQIMNAIRSNLEKYYADKGGYPQPTGWYHATLTTYLFNGLSTGYLDTYVTGALTDPGCGGGTTYNVKAVTSPCGTTVYAYTYGPVAGATCTAPATGYTLTLTKEGGGTAYFCSPQ
jgi:prepilin-type N-terminal cleavage/methylation domain-containing protein